MKGRETVARINLKNLAHNFKVVKKAVGRSKVLCVVKANAYGHGLVEVARKLESEGADWFGVAITEEGILLRESGIKGNILILNGFFPGDGENVVRYSLIPAVFDEWQINELEKIARKMNVRIRVHLKVDTGMGRLGVMPDKFGKLLSRIYSSKNLILDGIFSHFAHADFKDRKFIKKQLSVFLALTEKIKVKRHIANSAGTFLLPQSHLDMVRSGIALYGVAPSRKLERVMNLKPVMSLRTKVHAVKELPKGHGVSYGHTYRMKRKERIAVIPIGYGDGFLRMNSNRGHVLIKGEKCPVIGVVCMDLTVVNVSHLKTVRPGDEVVIIGRQKGKILTAHDLAESSATIPYEVLCSISPRVRREYIT